MKFTIVVDVQIPPPIRRVFAAVVAPFFLLVAFGSTVDAAPPSFASGETLSATKVNGAFGEMDARLAKVEARLDSAGKFSVGATFCGATLGATPGDLSGLGGAKGWAGT